MRKSLQELVRTSNPAAFLEAAQMIDPSIEDQPCVADFVYCCHALQNVAGAAEEQLFQRLFDDGSVEPWKQEFSGLFGDFDIEANQQTRVLALLLAYEFVKGER